MYIKKYFYILKPMQAYIAIQHNQPRYHRCFKFCFSATALPTQSQVHASMLVMANTNYNKLREASTGLAVPAN